MHRLVLAAEDVMSYKRGLTPIELYRGAQYRALAPTRKRERFENMASVSLLCVAADLMMS